MAVATCDTINIPVVFVLSQRPVGPGARRRVMAKPGGNITGFTFIELSLISKWVGIIKQMAPAATQAALLFRSGHDSILSTLLAFDRGLSFVTPVRIKRCSRAERV